MYPVVSEFQNVKESPRFVFIAEYFEELRKNHNNDKSLIELKASRIMFRIACIGLSGYQHSHNRYLLMKLSQAIVMRYMIDGPVLLKKSKHGSISGSAYFSLSDYDYCCLVAQEGEWIEEDKIHISKQKAEDFAINYNRLSDQVICVREKKLNRLKKFKQNSSFDVLFSDEKINFFDDILINRIDADELYETLKVLNSFYKTEIGTEINYYDEKLSNYNLLLNKVKFHKIEKEGGKAPSPEFYEVTSGVKVDKIMKNSNFAESSSEKNIQQEMLKEILQSTNCISNQGEYIQIIMKNKTTSRVLLAFVGMIVYDYHREYLKVNTCSQEQLLSGYLYQSEDISKDAPNYMRRSKEQEKLIIDNPEIIKLIIEETKKIIPKWEEGIKKYDHLTQKHYTFLLRSTK